MVHVDKSMSGRTKEKAGVPGLRPGGGSDRGGDPAGEGAVELACRLETRMESVPAGMTSQVVTVRVIVSEGADVAAPPVPPWRRVRATN